MKAEAMTRRALSIFLVALVLLATSAPAQRIDTAISFRGQLNQAGTPANGNFDFRLTLYDAETAGNPLASSTINAAGVFDGRYSFPVDFGAGVFDGSPRWIEVAVADPNGTGGFQTLNRRTQIFVVPYAERSLSVLGGHAAADQACPSNQVVSGINGDGNLVCVAGDGGGSASTAAFQRILVVPGDLSPSDNGSALAQAVALTQPVATASAPWLIYLEPGTYDLGTQGLILTNIALEGAGIDATTITSTATTTLRTFANSGLRNLTAVNAAVSNSSGGHVAAIHIWDAVAVDNVRAVSTSPANASFPSSALAVGAGDGVHLTHVQAVANRTAIDVGTASRLTMHRVDVHTDMTNAPSGSRAVYLSNINKLEVDGLTVHAEALDETRLEGVRIHDVSGFIGDVDVLAKTAGTSPYPASSAYAITFHDTDGVPNEAIRVTDLRATAQAPADALPLRIVAGARVDVNRAVLRAKGGSLAIGLQIFGGADALRYEGTLTDFDIAVQSPSFAIGTYLGELNGTEVGVYFSEWSIALEGAGTASAHGIDLIVGPGKDIVFEDIDIQARNTKSADGFRARKTAAGDGALILRDVHAETYRSSNAEGAHNYAATFISESESERLRLIIEESRFKSHAPDVISPGFTQGVLLIKVDADIRNSSFEAGGNWSLFADCCSGNNPPHSPPSTLRLVDVTAIDAESGNGSSALSVHDDASATVINSYINGTTVFGNGLRTITCVATTVSDTRVDNGDCSNIPRISLF